MHAVKKDGENGWETDSKEVDINIGVDANDNDNDDNNTGAVHQGGGDVQWALLCGTRTPIQSPSPALPPLLPSPLHARSTGSMLPPRMPARF